MRIEQLRKEHDVQIRWIHFPLHPDTPAQGRSLADAVLEAAHLRFRPIVMTSLAFILGVLPLVLASGAGSASQHSIGTGVLGGMLSATALAVFFVPVFFVVVRGIFKGSERQRQFDRAHGHAIGVRRDGAQLPTTHSTLGDVNDLLLPPLSQLLQDHRIEAHPREGAASVIGSKLTHSQACVLKESGLLELNKQAQPSPKSV